MVLISNIFRGLVTIIGAGGLTYSIIILINTFKSHLVLFTNDKRRLHTVRLWAIGFMVLWFGVIYNYIRHISINLTLNGFLTGLALVLLSIGQFAYLRFQYGTMRGSNGK